MIKTLAKAKLVQGRRKAAGKTGTAVAVARFLRRYGMSLRTFA
jgi:hypothetical protein